MHLLILAGLVACASPEPTAAPAVAPPAVAPPAPAAPPADTTRAARGPGGAHGATPHRHDATHGGEVEQIGPFHLEGRFLKSGLLVWVRDAADAPVDLATVKGTAILEGPAGVTTVMLASMGDHLHAQMVLPEGVPAAAVVNLDVAGLPVSVAFRTSAVGGRSRESGAIRRAGD